MIAAIADTHALIWYLAADKRLSEGAQSTINRIADEGQQVGVPAICLVETRDMNEFVDTLIFIDIIET